MGNYFPHQRIFVGVTVAGLASGPVEQARSGPMAKTAAAPEQLRKGTKVVNRVELRDVPEGTAGKVIMVAGLTWIRYWVRFDNGVSLGTVRRDQLATTDEWRRHLAGEDVFGSTGSLGGAGDDDAVGGDDTGGGGGVTTPNGTFVPQKLIDKAKAARARLAA